MMNVMDDMLMRKAVVMFYFSTHLLELSDAHALEVQREPRW
jgi:hypothetical protein